MYNYWERSGGFFEKIYMPLVTLPIEQENCEAVLQRIYELGDTSVIFSSNPDAFKYVIGELVDNIYEHSGFKHAFVMAQKYSNLGFIELGFLDDGVTIPGSFRKYGWPYGRKEHYQAITDAIRGLSTKKEAGRGYGLDSSVKIFLELGGQVLVVSGYGAVYLDSQEMKCYRLTTKHRMAGTLISLRVRDIHKTVDIYKLLGG